MHILRSGLYGIVFIYLLASCVVSDSENRKTKEMSPSISKEEAIEIARKRALEYPHGFFKEPFVESAVRQTTTDHWVVKLLSFNPQPKPGTYVKGAMYMYVTIDKTTGSILAVDAGGGS